MFAELEKYRKQHGDCLVPFGYEENASLGKWVSRQHEGFSKLSLTRRDRLDSIGFIWDPSGHRWEETFDKLEKYCKLHGDCLVPYHYKEDPSLASWVSTQRRQRSKLNSIRRDRLESIGFVWDPHDQQWEVMFARLKKYRQQHGDCLVPIHYKEDPSLGKWVSNQRSNYCNLNSTRRNRLDSIGFVWDARHRLRSVF